MAFLNKYLLKNRNDQPILKKTELLKPELQRKQIDASSKVTSDKKFDFMAQASLQLALLGPSLATMAADMAKEAKNQAARTIEITNLLKGFTKDLGEVVRELRTSSDQVENALDTVSRIAKHTSIISINAGIEASRAGEQGRTFGVVVDEIQRLADQTGKMAQVIEDRINNMHQSILHVSEIASNETCIDGAQKNNVATVNRQVQGMAQYADKQLHDAESLHNLSNNVNSCTEKLLHALGTFRFAAHSRAEHEVARIIPLLEDAFGNREACETILEKWLRELNFFELAYATDAGGVQFIDNICKKDEDIIHDKKGLGQDWSRRAWYLDAIKHEGIRSTDIYRSTATGDFCFTVTAVMRDSRGKIIGVTAADVNFRRLLQK
ncbi:MAG: methyl-accepting chemotaxis protein [Smithella sp.]